MRNRVVLQLQRNLKKHLHLEVRVICVFPIRQLQWMLLHLQRILRITSSSWTSYYPRVALLTIKIYDIEFLCALNLHLFLILTISKIQFTKQPALAAPQSRLATQSAWNLCSMHSEKRESSVILHKNRFHKTKSGSPRKDCRRIRFVPNTSKRTRTPEFSPVWAF